MKSTLLLMGAFVLGVTLTSLVWFFVLPTSLPGVSHSKDEQSITLLQADTEQVAPTTYFGTGIVRAPLDRGLLWKREHAKGYEVSLYRKDAITEYVDSKPIATAYELILESKIPDGTTQVLFDKVPSNPRIGNDSDSKGDFLANGAYFTYIADGYESSIVRTFDLTNGNEVFTEPKFGYPVKPYWNTDGTRLIVIRSSSSFDGTTAAIFFSMTGKPEDAQLIKVWNSENDWNVILGNVREFFDGVSFEMQYDTTYSQPSTPEKPHGSAETFTINYNTGTISSLGTHNY